MTPSEGRFAARVHYVLELISLACLAAAALWNYAGNRLFDAFTSLPVFAQHPLAFSAALHLPVWALTVCGLALGSVALAAQVMNDIRIYVSRRQQGGSL
ncbi:hypothetical protein [Pantoea agglomerans]|uniref:Uncharacterized protein n=1 Tax=Enterobacter agglomerans TaxID=549 RepID=A0AAN2FH95_ENTAG|nr:hypothetical protein [Pantoea agglomerans]CAH6374847.1 hypothetical protein DAPPPG734_23820 [Pantoea agglomerans]